MLDIQKYRLAIEDKIRYVEKSTTGSVLLRDLYAANVGHVTGLLDALEILNQLVSNDEQENNNGIEDQEDAG